MKCFYQSYRDAAKAAQRLGIQSRDDYKDHHIIDPKLPATPAFVYEEEFKNNGGWFGFLGKKAVNFYRSYQDASSAARRLGIKSRSEYQLLHCSDSKLPATPHQVYYPDFQSHGGWYGFLGKQIPDHYTSYQIAATAAQRQGFKNQAEYRRSHRRDPRLPADPYRKYQPDFQLQGGWNSFLGKKAYDCYQEAATAAQRLGIQNCTDYRKCHRKDPKLPYSPDILYKPVFQDQGGWRAFLNTGHYKTYQEAATAARQLHIQSKSDYKKRYKADPRLPANPGTVYRPEFLDKGGWREFLDTGIEFYATYQEASAAAIRLKVQTKEEYQKYYRQNPRLPVSPDKFYKPDFQNNGCWYGFLGKKPPDFYTTYQEASAAAQSVGIRSSKDYKRLYKQDLRLPANPNEIYSSEFQKRGGWHHFLGNDLPYTPQHISSDYKSWSTRIEEYLQQARGAHSKAGHLCRFVRLHIEAHQLDTSPESFILSDEQKIPEYRQYLKQLTDYQRDKGHRAIYEFMEWVLDKYLTLHEEPCIPPRVKNAKNPFRLIELEKAETVKPSQTVRPLLPFSYLEQMGSWIIPQKAKSFRDLSHLYDQFDCDWHIITPDLLDKSSPDCVWKEKQTSNGIETLIWSPSDWLLAFALIKTGLRGGMLAYADSGEADTEIPCLNANGNIFWQPNVCSMAGETNRQGIIVRCEDHHVGIYTPMNKTGAGKGFFCPWMDESLAYWLIKLRQFQSIYNPISAPTPWESLTRLPSYNLEQKKAKGRNCFLFREWGTGQPNTFGVRLKRSVATALYHIQDPDLKLATVTPGKERVLGHYKSIYVPHSIRGSFITGLVIEGGLSPVIVMKLVGHHSSSIIMTCYYCKPSNTAIRHKIDEAQKKALQNQALDKQIMIEQGKIDKIRNELVGNSQENLRALLDIQPTTHPASYVFSDIGFCPYAGARCNDGGEKVEKSGKFNPVPEGYLGKSNCLRCRFFCTGPAWIGGLLSISNEILLAANKQAAHYHQLRNEKKQLGQRLNALNVEEYDAEQSGKVFDQTRKIEIKAYLRKTDAEIEKASLKLLTLLDDIQSASKLLRQCHALINQHSEKTDNHRSQELIVPANMELELNCEEVSYFHQLANICENATIYQSAKADMAVLPRSQMLDRMAKFNGMVPSLFELSERQQLYIGNEITKFLLTRLKSWRRVEDVIQGKIYLKDLTGEEAISCTELEKLLPTKEKYDLPLATGDS